MPRKNGGRRTKDSSAVRLVPDEHRPVDVDLRRARPRVAVERLGGAPGDAALRWDLEHARPREDLGYRRRVRRRRWLERSVRSKRQVKKTRELQDKVDSRSSAVLDDTLP